jgi:hypothetical protein
MKQFAIPSSRRTTPVKSRDFQLRAYLFRGPRRLSGRDSLGSELPFIPEERRNHSKHRSLHVFGRKYKQLPVPVLSVSVFALKSVLPTLLVLTCESAFAQGTLRFDVFATGTDAIPPNDSRSLANGTFTLTGNVFVGGAGFRRGSFNSFQSHPQL